MTENETKMGNNLQWCRRAGLLLNGNVLGAAAAIIEKKQAVMTCAYGTETVEHSQNQI